MDWSWVSEDETWKLQNHQLEQIFLSCLHLFQWGQILDVKSKKKNTVKYAYVKERTGA